MEASIDLPLGRSFARPRIAFEVEGLCENGTTGAFVRGIAAYVDTVPIGIHASKDGPGAMCIEPGSCAGGDSDLAQWGTMEHGRSAQLDGLVIADPHSNTVDRGGADGVRKRWGENPPECREVAVETESRLQQHAVRHHFLVRLFAYAELRDLGPEPSIAALSDFQRRHKHLLMTYDPQAMRALGRIASDAELDAEGRYRVYAVGFRAALRGMPSRGAYVNALMHMYGHFKRKLSAAESESFLVMLDEFAAGSQELAAVCDVIHGWCERFGYAYLADQSMLALYPRALALNEEGGEGVRF